MITELDKSGKVYILGADVQQTFQEILTVVEATRYAHYLVGDPGSGKSHMMKEVAKEYARRNDVPAFYTVIDEDATRALVLAGHRLVNGSLEPFRAVVGHAMEVGGIVCVDEVPHGPLSIQSVFNTVIDQDSRTSIGDLMLVGHPKFRIIFGGNRTKHPGNVGLKTSFASRLLAWEFDYPSALSEVKIVKSIVMQELDAQTLALVPDSMIKFLVSWAREIREATHGNLPISARNMALVVSLLALLPRDNNAKMLPKFTNGTASNPLREKVAQRVLLRPVKDDSDLVHSSVQNVLALISQIGEERFAKAVMQGSMYYFDIEGTLDSIMKQYREMMRSSLV